MWLFLSAALAADPAPNSAAAAKTYAAECSTCHGAAGDGKGPAAVAFNPKPTSFTDAAWWGTKTDADVAKAIRTVKPGTPMAGFSNLSDAQVADIAVYLRTFRP